MLVLPSALGAWERDTCALAVDGAEETQIQAQTLRGVHEIGAGDEADDDVRTDLGEGPGLAL